MSNRRLQVACAGAFLLMAPRAAHAQQPTQPVADDASGRILGIWQGVLASGAFRERVLLAIARDSTGGVHGIMKMLDQGGVELPATIAARDGRGQFDPALGRIARDHRRARRHPLIHDRRTTHHLLRRDDDSG